jgi:HEAT repeat protein
VVLFFISYKHEDIDFAKVLWRRVNAHPGFTGWIDTDLVAGDDWDKIIDNQLEQAVGVIVIITPQALKSHYVTYEWSYAFGNHKKIIPILLKPINKSKLHKKLQNTQYIDFTHADYTNLDDPAWEDLFKDLRDIQAKYDIPSSVANAKNTILTSHNQTEWEGALTEIKDDTSQQSIEVLADLLKSTFTSPKKNIAIALSFAEKTNYSDERPIEALHQGIIGNLSTNLATNALGKIGTAKAIERLIDAFNQLPKERNQRQWLIESLRYSKDVTARKYLEQEVSEGQLRADAAIGLGVIGDPQSVPLLLTMLLDPRVSASLKTHLATALGKIGDPSVVPALVKLADSYSHDVEFLDADSMATLLKTIGIFNTEEGNSALKRFKNYDRTSRFRGIIIDALKRNNIS